MSETFKSAALILSKTVGNTIVGGVDVPLVLGEMGFGSADWQLHC